MKGKQVERWKYTGREEERVRETVREGRGGGERRGGGKGAARVSGGSHAQHSFRSRGSRPHLPGTMNGNIQVNGGRGGHRV